MVRKSNHRLFLFIAACSVMGVTLGGLTSHAEMKQCMVDENTTNECLVQNPIVKTLEGMSFGLFAGAGAAIGATWHLWNQEK